MCNNSGNVRIAQKMNLISREVYLGVFADEVSAFSSMTVNPRLLIPFLIVSIFDSSTCSKITSPEAKSTLI